MYASTIRKINLGKKPPFFTIYIVYTKRQAQVGRCIYLTAMTHLSCKKRGEIYLRNSVYKARKKAVQSKATRLCTRLQGCFSGGGRWHLLEGNFRAGKGEPAKVGLQAHSLLGETSLSMHPRTKGQPLLL